MGFFVLESEEITRAKAPFNGSMYIPYMFMSIWAFALVMRLGCFTGLIASDDLVYSDYAQLISQGLYVPELHHFAIRYGLTVPVAATYRIFGVQEWTTVAVPLLASTASIPLLMMISWKAFGLRTSLIAGLLLVTFPVQLRYATILVPEPVAGFYILVAVLAYLHTQGKQAFLLGLAAGISLGVAYLTKEATLFVAPALMLDAAARRRWWVMLWIMLGLGIVVAAEHAYYFSHTGDLWLRPNAMVVHNVSPMALDANEDLYYRLVKSYPRMMLRPNEDFGLHSIFALSLAVPALFLFSIEKLRLFILWALLPWLYLNFGTSSLSSYFALPVAPRYIDFIYPPLFLMAAAVIARYTSNGKRLARPLVLTLTLVGAVGFACGLATRNMGYRTDEVAALSIISGKAKQAGLKYVQFEEDPHDIWQRTMAILAADLESRTDPESAEIIIRPDTFGLPAVIRAADDSPIP